MASQTEKRVVEIMVNGVQAGSTIKELGKDVRALKAYIGQLKPGTEEFVRASKKLQEVEGQFNRIKGQAFGMTSAWGKMRKEFLTMTTSVVGGNVITSVFEKLVGIVPQAISGAARLSDELADIQKTTGLSSEEVKKLNKELGKINTRTGTSELRQIAIVAGQLGIPTDQILKFTDATDKLVVSLGDEFSGGAEEITKVMGGLRNVFTDIKSQDIGSDMLHIGNALNVLGSEGAATAPVVADFANRIGGVGISLGLTSGQVLGLSATMQELNISTERGGTAITKILLKMSSNVEAFSKVAGVTAEEFKEKVNTDIFGAFMMVAKGSQKSAAAATEFSAMLDKLGVDGAGASEVLSKVGANTDLLTKKVDLANGSLSDTSSVMGEFATKNENFAAQWEKAMKAIAKFTAPVMGVIGNLAAFFTEGIGMTDAERAAAKLTKSFENQTAKVKNLEDNIVPLMDRIDELNHTTGKSEEEQKELEEAIQKVGRAIPGAVTQFDAYGRAMEVSTTKARELLDIEKKRLKFINEEAIKSNEKVVNELEKKAKTLQSNLKAGTTTLGISAIWKAPLETLRNPVAAQVKKMDDSDYAETIEELQEVQDKLAGAKAEVARLKGDTLDAEQDIVQTKIEYTKLSIEELSKLNDAAAQAELERRKNLNKLSEEESKKFVENTKKFLQKIEDLKAEVIVDEEQRNLKKLEVDFQQQQKEIRSTAANAKVKADLLKLLEENYNKEVGELKDKYSKERTEKDYETAVKAEADRLAVQKLHQSMALADGTISKQQYDEKMLEIERQHKAELLAIAKKYGKDTTQLEQDIVNATIAINDATKELIKKQMETRIELKRKYLSKESEELLQAETDYLEAQKEQDIAALQDMVANKLLTTEQAEQARLDIIAYYNGQIEDLERSSNKRTWDERIKMLEEWSGKFNNLMGSLNQIKANHEQAEINDTKKKNESRIAQLTQLHEKKLISEEEYNSQVAIINAETDRKIAEVQRKQAQREKEMAMFNAVMSGATAVMRIAAEFPKFDFGIATGIAIAAQIALTAAQVAAIQSQPAPEFSGGGFTGNGFGAPDSSGFKVAGVVHEGEYVVPKWMVRSPQYFSTISMLESSRRRGYAEGGFTSDATATGGFGSSSSTDSNMMLAQALQQNTAVLMQVRDLLANPRPAVAVLDYDYFVESSEELASLQQGSRLK